MVLPTPNQLESMQQHRGDSKVASILAVNIVCTIIVYFIVALRLYARRFVPTQQQADDWLIVLAVVLFTGFAMGYVAATKYGAGRHIIVVTNPKSFYEIYLVLEGMYLSCVVSIKTSILCLYNRIFPIRWLKIMLWLTGAFVLSWGIFAFLISIFKCVPVRASWDPNVTSARCLKYGTYAQAFGVMNIATDFVLLALPMRPVWMLHMSTGRKWAVTAMFVVGCGACIISIIRLAFVQQMDAEYDSSWTFTPTGVISVAELGVGIFAACIPTLRPLVNAIVERQRALLGKPNKSNIPFEAGKDDPHETKPIEYQMWAGVDGRGAKEAWSRTRDDEEQLVHVPRNPNLCSA